MSKEEFLKVQIQKMRMPLQFMKMMPQGGPANGNFNVGQPSNQNGGGGGVGKQPLALQEDEDDDEFDDEDEYDDCEDDEEFDDVLMNKPLPKPGMIGNGIGPPMPSMPKRGPQMSGNGGMHVLVQVNPGGGVGANGGGKKVATGGGNRKKGGSGGAGANGGGGGGKKDANNGQDKNAGIGGLAASMRNMIANGAKKGGETSEGASNGMPNAMVAANGGGGQMGSNHPTGQMGNQAGFQGMPPMPGVMEQMAGNPYYQLLAALMMNQKRDNGNERFQPMMHARPPPAVNYMQPYPAYPYRPQANQYTMFNDENTSSCRVM